MLVFKPKYRSRVQRIIRTSNVGAKRKADEGDVEAKRKADNLINKKGKGIIYT